MQEIIPIRVCRPLRWLFTLIWTSLFMIILVQPESQPVINTGIPPAPPTLGREILFSTLHIISFALTTLLWLWTLCGHLAPAFALGAAVVLVLLLAISTELAQGHSPGRSPQLSDMIANAAGMIVGLWLYRQKIKTWLYHDKL